MNTLILKGYVSHLNYVTCPLKRAIFHSLPVSLKIWIPFKAFSLLKVKHLGLEHPHKENRYDFLYDKTKTKQRNTFLPV